MGMADRWSHLGFNVAELRPFWPSGGSWMGLHFDVLKVKKWRSSLVTLNVCSVAAMCNSIQEYVMLPDDDTTYHVFKIAIFAMVITSLSVSLKTHSAMVLAWSAVCLKCCFPMLFVVSALKGETHIPAMVLSHVMVMPCVLFSFTGQVSFMCTVFTLFGCIPGLWLHRCNSGKMPSEAHKIETKVVIIMAAPLVSLAAFVLYKIMHNVGVVLEFSSDISPVTRVKAGAAAQLLTVPTRL